MKIIKIKDKSGNSYKLTYFLMEETRARYYAAPRYAFCEFFSNSNNEQPRIARVLRPQGFSDFTISQKNGSPLSIGCREFNRKTRSIIRRWALGRKQ